MFQGIAPQQAIHTQFRRQRQHESFDIGETLCVYLHAGEAHDRSRHDAVHRRTAFLMDWGLHVQIEIKRDVWGDQGAGRPGIGSQPIAIGGVEKTGDEHHPTVPSPAADAIATASHSTTARSVGIGSLVYNRKVVTDRA